MTAFVTLPVAKRHLRVDHSDDDDDIQLKIEAASEVVVDYIKYPEGWEGWNETTAPTPVQVSVLIMLSKFYDDRDAGKEDGEIALGYLPKSVTAILHRYRDPALA